MREVEIIENRKVVIKTVTLEKTKKNLKYNHNI